MSDPLVPNYVNGVGRLVTDRFDFQKHVDGYSFRHDANQIDLSPSVVVGVTTETTVQGAIEQLSNYILPPVIPEATTTSQGIIQLSGDLSGTASLVTVTGLQTQPVVSTVPVGGDVLTYNGSGYWEPSAPLNTFTAGGDLYGTNISQSIQSLAGDPLGGDVTILCSKLTFDENQTGVITQNDSTSFSLPLTIKAQSNLNNNYDGGGLVLSGGDSGGGTGLQGPIQLSTGNSNILAELTEVVQNQLVLSLCKTTALTSTEMPSDTGSGVIYIANAATDPGAGNPVSGSILYSSGGKLYVKQADGDNFAIGSIPNPSIWGTGNNYIYSFRATASTIGNSPVTAFSYTMPNFTTVKVDVLIVGKAIDLLTNRSYHTNMSRSFSINPSGGTVTPLSATNYVDTQNLNLLGITAPDITNVGTLLSVTTGAIVAKNIDWLVVVQLTVCG